MLLEVNLRPRKAITIFLSILILAFAIVFIGCGGSGSGGKNGSNETTYSISGYIQKGPFINGTSLTVYELAQNFSQTGSSYSSQVYDNIGSFEIVNIGIHHPWS
jgi:hypothetical protein